MSTRTALYLPSRAKLNLVLRIVGRRDDGYHLLESLFHALDLHDDVVVESVAGGDAVRIDVTAEEQRLLVPADDSNLAVKALQLLREEVRRGAEQDVPGFDVRLHKRIPNGGGLGGGSSNAAAVLRLANRLLGEPLTIDQLGEIGARLGADVPFFLRGGTQWGRGIGTVLESAQPVSGNFVLLVPPYGCGTVEVYKKHAALWRGQASQATVGSITVPDNWDSAVGIGFCNELERAAEQVRPELGRLRSAVVDAGYAHARMSGSGSTLFVAAPDAESAQQCQRQLASALAQTEHRGVTFVATTSGPAIDVDQPSSQIPATLRHRPPDPLG